MRKVLRIDSNGFFIEDVILENKETTPKDCIESECQNGYYRPRWNGEKWVEGLTPQEIEAIENTPIPKTEFEILKEAVEQLVLANLEV